MLRVAIISCALSVACGDDRAGTNATPDAGSGTGGVAMPSARVVGTIAPDGVRSLAIAALDDHRVAIARAETVGTAFCPDCVGLDPSQCPDVCTRSRISVALHDADAQRTGAWTPVATVFPPTDQYDVNQVEVVALDGDRAGVAWLECDNSSCMGLYQKQSCTARYATVDLGTGAVGPIATLYEGWFGDVQLAFDATTSTLLAVVGKREAFGVGVRRALFDETGAHVLSAWKPLGSFATRAAATLARGGKFLIVADDRSPSQPAPAAPCAQSCDCLGAGGAELDAGGLFAFDVAASGDTSTRVATGRGDDGFYATREQIAVIDLGDGAMIADTESIDRSAEIFTEDRGAWVPRLRSKAPIPVWIGALGTADHYAWLGSEVEPGQQATVQRLVAGVAVGNDSARATFTDPVDRNVFEAAPVATSAGVTKTFLLQGVFGHVGNQVVWDRFELLSVEAGW